MKYLSLLGLSSVLLFFGSFSPVAAHGGIDDGDGVAAKEESFNVAVIAAGAAGVVMVAAGAFFLLRKKRKNVSTS